MAVAVADPQSRRHRTRDERHASEEGAAIVVSIVVAIVVAIVVTVVGGGRGVVLRVVYL